MAEFENGYCTGCGYKVLRWGHRPYCWRVVCHQLAHVDPTIKTVVKRCLKKMQQHHRFISLFLCKKKHMYYTMDSIDVDNKRDLFTELKEGLEEIRDHPDKLKRTEKRHGTI